MLILFATASAAMCAAPGPDNLFVLTHSALHGRVTGWYATLGFSTGLIVHTTAVSLGVAALFQTSELAFNLLKLAGAAYLFYLAWRFVQRSNSPLPLQRQPQLELREPHHANSYHRHRWSRQPAPIPAVRAGRIVRAIGSRGNGIR
jgi:threonine/homoserine/homoserine lactone efflux protein